MNHAFCDAIHGQIRAQRHEIQRLATFAGLQQHLGVGRCTVDKELRELDGKARLR